MRNRICTGIIHNNHQNIVSPFWPRSPGLPSEPGTPDSPFSPCGPGSPGGPVTVSVGPGGPVQETNFCFIEVRV